MAHAQVSALRYIRQTIYLNRCACWRYTNSMGVVRAGTATVAPVRVGDTPTQWVSCERAPPLSRLCALRCTCAGLHVVLCGQAGFHAL